MADNIQFRVDAVLGDTTRLQQQINNLRTNLNLTINNTQALQSIRQVQQQINNLRNSMTNMNLNIGGSGGGGSYGGRPPNNNANVGQPLVANQQFQTSAQSVNSIQGIIDNLNTQINGTVSKLRLCTDETGRIVGGTAEITQGATTWTRNIEQARDAQGQIIEGQYRLTEQSRVAVDNTKKYNGALTQQIKMQFKQYAVYYAVSSVIRGIADGISNCVNYAIDLDSAMTNIRVVTMDTKEETKDLLKTYNQLGQELGANTLDIAEGAIDWLRQGYSEADTTELVKNSTILSKLALIDNAQATEYLTSALKGYKLEAKDAIGVIDQLVSIDLEAATSAGDMAEAMSRTANMAKTTGFEMNELLGMIATMSEVTQNSASTIGNSVKTILSRMSNVKAGLDDFEGEALNDVEKTLNRVGIALRDNQGNWYDFYDVLDEVASKWDSFSDVQQSQITTALGGTRQRENILVALENWDKVKQYASTGADSAGTAMEKYDIVLESVSAKQEQLNAKVQEFYNNISNSGLIAGILEVGKGFMDVMNWGDGLIGKLLLLTTVTIAVAGAMNMLHKTAIYTKLGLEGMALGAKIATVASAGLKAVLDLLKSHPIIFFLSALIAVVMAVKSAFDYFNVTLEEQHEKAQQAQQDYEEIKNELQAVNDELKTTRERIDELNSKDKLTFTEKEELERLKAENAELEKRAYWLDVEAKKKQKETTEEASKAWDKDFNDSTEEFLDWTPENGGVGYDRHSMTETDWINRQVKEYENLNNQIQQVINSEGEWANATEEKKKAKYDDLIEEKQRIEEYLQSTGVRIQTDFIDAYPDVDPSTMQGWIDLRDIIQEALNPPSPTQKLSTLLEKQGKDWNDYYTTLAKDGVLTTKDFSDSFKKQIKETFNLDDNDAEGLNNILNDIIYGFKKSANSAEDAEAVFSDVTSELSNLIDHYDLLNDVQDEYKKQGEFSLETLEAIEKAYPDMAESIGLYLAGLKSEKDLLNDLQNAYATDVSNYENSVKAKLALSPEFYAGLTSAQQQNVRALYESYGADFRNYKTVEEAKLSFNAQVIQTLAKRWQQYAGMTKQQLIAERNRLGSINDKKGGNWDGQEWDDLNKAINDMNNFEKSLDNIVYKGVDFTPKNFKNLSGDKSKSSSSSSSSKEWWETQLETLKNQLEYNEISMDTYIDGIENILGKLKKGTDAWNEVNKELQEAKLENVENQFDRGEITIDQYIEKLIELRKAYKEGTEGYKELTETINDAKYDKFSSQYERGEITIDQYIEKLRSLQEQYKQGSEEYKKLADEIDEIKLEKTEKYLDKLQDRLDKLDQKIDELGEVNTDKESIKYAQLLSQKYEQVQENIASIKEQLKDTNLTEEQREALQEELNDLLKEEVDIRDEIEDQVKTYYENQKEQAEKQAELKKKQTLYNKEVELYGEQGKELFEYYTNKEIEALEAKKDALDENNEREQLENDILEARLKLQNALNSKTTKILKKQSDGTWQYEYSANMVEVKNAQEELANAEKALEEYDLQSQIDELNKNMQNLADQYADAEFWAEREYEQTMNAIDKAYGDIDSLVEKWMDEYGDSTTELVTSYQSLVSANNKLEQSLVNLESAIESKYETVGTNKVSTKDGVKSFDTGGKIVGNGLILAHDKERVLTTQQNLYFEQLISKLPQLLKAVDVTKFGGYISSKTFGSRVSADKVNSTVIHNVNCNFPNINSTDGLQQAILQLPRLALQNK